MKNNEHFQKWFTSKKKILNIKEFDELQNFFNEAYEFGFSDGYREARKDMKEMGELNDSVKDEKTI